MKCDYFFVEVLNILLTILICDHFRYYILYFHELIYNNNSDFLFHDSVRDLRLISYLCTSCFCWQSRGLGVSLQIIQKFENIWLMMWYSSIYWIVDYDVLIIFLIYKQIFKSVEFEFAFLPLIILNKNNINKRLCSCRRVDLCF